MSRNKKRHRTRNRIAIIQPAFHKHIPVTEDQLIEGQRLGSSLLLRHRGCIQTICVHQTDCVHQCDGAWAWLLNTTGLSPFNEGPMSYSAMRIPLSSFPRGKLFGAQYVQKVTYHLRTLRPGQYHTVHVQHPASILPSSAGVRMRKMSGSERILVSR